MLSSNWICLTTPHTPLCMYITYRIHITCLDMYIYLSDNITDNINLGDTFRYKSQGTEIKTELFKNYWVISKKYREVKVSLLQSIKHKASKINVNRKNMAYRKPGPRTHMPGPRAETHTRVFIPGIHTWDRICGSLFMEQIRETNVRQPILFIRVHYFGLFLFLIYNLDVLASILFFQNDFN